MDSGVITTRLGDKIRPHHQAGPADIAAVGRGGHVSRNRQVVLGRPDPRHEGEAVPIGTASPSWRGSGRPRTTCRFLETWPPRPTAAISAGPAWWCGRILSPSRVVMTPLSI